jgi:hypothetical protein
LVSWLAAPPQVSRELKQAKGRVWNLPSNFVASFVASFVVQESAFKLCRELCRAGEEKARKGIDKARDKAHDKEKTHAKPGSAIRAKGCAIQTGCRGAATGAPLRQKPRNAPEPARSQAEASLKRLPLRLADPHINADTPVANRLQ